MNSTPGGIVKPALVKKFTTRGGVMTRTAKIASTASLTIVLLAASAWWISPKEERIIVVPPVAKTSLR